MSHLSTSHRSLLSALFATLALAGCAESDDAATPNESQQAVAAECPDVADTCAEGCRELTALRFDAERNCRERNATVIGCNAPELQTSDSPCYRRVSDGSLWFGSSSAFPHPAFERCTGAELQLVRDTSGCE